MLKDLQFMIYERSKDGNEVRETSCRLDSLIEAYAGTDFSKMYALWDAVLAFSNAEVDQAFERGFMACMEIMRECAV